MAKGKGKKPSRIKGTISAARKTSRLPGMGPKSQIKAAARKLLPLKSRRRR